MDRKKEKEREREREREGGEFLPKAERREIPLVPSVILQTTEKISC